MVKEKTVHARDYIKNKDADVVKHGSGAAVPNTHWEKDVGESVFARGYGNESRRSISCTSR